MSEQNYTKPQTEQSTNDTHTGVRAERLMPKRKPWWWVYGGTISMVIVGIVVGGHGRWFEMSNPPPRFEELETQRIQVLNWQHLHPQLHVRLASGKERMVEFPTFSLRRDMYFVISQEQQRQLVGKTCQMWGRPLRASLEDHYQVFALDCGDGTGLKFEQSIRDYTLGFQSGQSSGWWIAFFVTLFTCSLTFWAETIRHRKSLQQGDKS